MIISVVSLLVSTSGIIVTEFPLTVQVNDKSSGSVLFASSAVIDKVGVFNFTYFMPLTMLPLISINSRAGPVRSLNKLSMEYPDGV